MIFKTRKACLNYKYLHSETLMTLILTVFLHFVPYFSLDSEFLASTSTDGSARIWKIEDGVPLTTLSRNSVCCIWFKYLWQDLYAVNCTTWSKFFFFVSLGWKNWIMSLFQGWNQTIFIWLGSERYKSILFQVYSYSTHFYIIFYIFFNYLLIKNAWPLLWILLSLSRW